MKRLFVLFVVIFAAIASKASAQNPPPFSGGWSYPSDGQATSYSSCYNNDQLYCEQVRKRLDRQFETENEWGYFEIKKIPPKFAINIQVFAVLQNGEERYVVGADRVNNFWDKEQPVPVTTKELRFKYVGTDYNATVVIPAFIRPSHIKNSKTTITLTENHFYNASFLKADLHHQRVENPDGSHTEFVRTKSGELVQQ